MCFLMGEHLLLTATVIAYFFTDGFYRLITAVFVNSLAVCSSYFICEQLVHSIKSQPNYHYGTSFYGASL